MQTVLLAILLIMAAVTDFRRRRIPNILTIPAIFAGIGMHAVFLGWVGFAFSTVGCAIGFMATYVLFRLHVVGGGDVKLFAAIGALAGADFVWWSLAYSIFIAGLFGAILLVVRREAVRFALEVGFHLLPFMRAGRLASWSEFASTRTMKIPFMLAVLPGTAAVWLGTAY